MRLEWNGLAVDNLLEIVSYIARENPVAAYEVDEEIHR